MSEGTSTVLGGRTTWSTVVLSIVAGAWLALLIDAIRRAPEILMADFHTYWAGVDRMLTGQPLYPPEQLRGPFVIGNAILGRGYVYPPTSALLSLPLAVVPLPLAFALFAAVSAAALGIVVWAIARSEGLDRTRSAAMTVIVLASGPSLSGLLTGNFNILIAALLGALWLRPRASGYLSVVGGLFKIYPAIGLAWTVRKRAPLAGPLVLGAVAVLVTTLLLGLRSWDEFRLTMLNAESTESFLIESPRSVLWYALGPTGGLVVALAITAALVALVFRLGDDHLAFIALGWAWIALAPDWQVHYFVVPLVAAVPWTARFLVTRSWKLPSTGRSVAVGEAG